jgi:hypothetical protein
MRNKHVSHDENNWMTPVPYAQVLKPGQQPVLGEIGCLVVEGINTQTLTTWEPSLTPHWLGSTKSTTGSEKRSELIC